MAISRPEQNLNHDRPRLKTLTTTSPAANAACVADWPNAGLTRDGSARAPFKNAVVAGAGTAPVFAERLGSIATDSGWRGVARCWQCSRTRDAITAAALIGAWWAFREGERRRRYPARRCDGRFRSGRRCQTDHCRRDGCCDESCTEQHTHKPLLPLLLGDVAPSRWERIRLRG
jgi:hypothetical protein